MPSAEQRNFPEAEAITDLIVSFLYLKPSKKTSFFSIVGSLPLRGRAVYPMLTFKAGIDTVNSYLCRYGGWEMDWQVSVAFSGLRCLWKCDRKLLSEPPLLWAASLTSSTLLSHRL